VQALAGLARVGEDRASYAEALVLYQRRHRLDFSPYWLCYDDAMLLDLARAATALGLTEEARVLRQSAAEKGSIEAQRGFP
jgi:hypothetical protein